MPRVFTRSAGAGMLRKFRAGTIRGAAIAAVAASGLLAIGAAQSQAQEAATAVALFGSSERASGDLSQFHKWTGMLERYARERALEDAPCTSGPCPLQRWRRFLTTLSGKSRLQQLEAVNRYANQVPYQSDQEHYGVVDYWATPAEFFGHSGDCEDYAIAKYFSLRHLGWEARDLRLLVLNDERRRELHAVLLAYHNGTIYVLDNLTPAIVEHTAIHHYRPIFSINEASWFIHEHWRPSAPTLVAAAPPARSVVPAPADRRVQFAARPASLGVSAPASPASGAVNRVPASVEATLPVR